MTYAPTPHRACDRCGALNPNGHAWDGALLVLRCTACGGRHVPEYDPRPPIRPEWIARARREGAADRLAFATLAQWADRVEYKRAAYARTHDDDDAETMLRAYCDGARIAQAIDRESIARPCAQCGAPPGSLCVDADGSPTSRTHATYRTP